MTSNIVKLMIYAALCVFCRPYREAIPGNILIDREVIRDNKANKLWSDSRLIAKTQLEQCIITAMIAATKIVFLNCGTKRKCRTMRDRKVPALEENPMLFVRNALDLKKLN
ncbi:hypothetical protein X798_00834 [Onchocerca flexuosa]|uniref:Uncharacterized protein n=1 Tax=Onchocerca flexuosa TaxID=387005 RepID=A0A238C4B4_9BILA|nr:hypothetical protein X798_00834 [Onchocerca flexuosa]